MLNSSRQVAEEASWKHLTALWSAENNAKKEIDKVWTAMNETGKQLDEKLVKIRHNLTGQINNVGKIAGPVGPPGFNGSQGPAGPPGPKGAGNFSTCQYKVKTEARGRDQTAYVDEPTGHIIIAATCSTNYAEDIEFRSAIVVHPKRRYICDCRGVKYSRQNPKNCSLHYWVCVKT
ncbi:unnamed protein product [Porites lobata]|uniref:Uncharacterized protein n=1 Tax=Porites lobata TaxID=104759 RepID=A0ABN8PFI3_9CNID|nr:unnamed protein product [Porites lobata]